MLNIQHLVEFIELHRDRGDKRCFHGWTRGQIIDTILEAFESHSAAIVYGPNGNSIQGFCHGIPFHDIKVFHVSNCLTDGSKGVMKQFMIILNRLWPDYSLEGQRYGRIKHYTNTSRFKQLLTNY